MFEVDYVRRKIFMSHYKSSMSLAKSRVFEDVFFLRDALNLIIFQKTLCFSTNFSEYTKPESYLLGYNECEQTHRLQTQYLSLIGNW